MYEAEIIEALTSRVGLSEVDAERVVQTICDVVDEGELELSKSAPPPRGSFFKDAVVSYNTGCLQHLSLFRRLRLPGHRKDVHLA